MKIIIEELRSYRLRSNSKVLIVPITQTDNIKAVYQHYNLCHPDPDIFLKISAAEGSRDPSFRFAPFRMAEKVRKTPFRMAEKLRKTPFRMAEELGKPHFKMVEKVIKTIIEYQLKINLIQPQIARSNFFPFPSHRFFINF